MKDIKSTVLLITAYDNAFGIGAADNKLLYHFKEDLEHFKEISKGSVMVMGRRTFESLPSLLPERKHVVVTRDPESWVKKYTHEYGDGSFLVARSLNQAMGFADTVAIAENLNRISVIGGADIYHQAMSYVDEFHITEIKARRDAETYFPIATLRSQSDLIEISSKDVETKAGVNLTFKTLARFSHVENLEPLYVLPIGDRQLVVLKTENGDERLVLNKIVSYRPERGTPTLVVGDDSGKDRRYRFESTSARNRAIVDLDGLLGEQINLGSH